jgi:transglutaminase-like putative cysteine protease
MLRSAGIPARPVTNYDSGHDTDGNKSLDYYWKADGTVDAARNRDSIWNFHVWCDAWMKRPDRLGQDGWQAVDATPQEESDGAYQCGPASHSAVKGDVGGNYDVDFVYAEVRNGPQNSDQ